MWPVAALLDSADEGQHLQQHSKFCWTALLWTARLAGRWPLGSLCRWPCENEYIFAALRWHLPALFCLLPVSWMVWECAPYCPPYRRRCDEWGHGGCSLPWHVTHQWQNPPWSCGPPETGLLPWSSWGWPSRALADRCPRGIPGMCGGGHRTYFCRSDLELFQNFWSDFPTRANEGHVTAFYHLSVARFDSEHLPS